MNISVIEFMEFLEFYRNFVSPKSPNFYFLLETKFTKGTKASLKKSERQQRIHNIAIGNATWQRKIEDSACLILMSHVSFHPILLLSCSCSTHYLFPCLLLILRQAE